MQRRMVWIEDIQDIPVFVYVITAAITGDPGGYALTVQLSYHVQGHIKTDIL